MKIPTKNKNVSHLKDGEVVVMEQIGGDRAWPVKITEYDKVPDHVGIRFSYDQPEPDGNGGSRMVARLTDVVPYHVNDTVRVPL